MSLAPRIIDIPVVYEVEHLPPRHRNPQRKFIRESVQIAIRVLDDEAAPVSFRVSPNAYGLHAAKTDVTEIRTVDRTHWRPLTKGWSGDDSELTADYVIAEMIEGRREINRPGLSDWMPNSAVGPEAIAAGRLIESGREAAIANVMAMASKLIIVGDRIYKPTSEPVWEIVEFHGGAFIKATNISAVKGTPSAESVFPAFFYDRAIEQLLASGVRRRSIDNGDAVSGKIEVVRPDLVFYRHDETPRFLGEAKYAFTEARRKMGEQIDSITAAQLEAYQAFSATIRDNADPHEIATRWRVLVDTVADAETFGHFCKSAHRSLEAWDRYVADVAAEQSLGLLA